MKLKTALAVMFGLAILLGFSQSAYVSLEPIPICPGTPPGPIVEEPRLIGFSLKPSIVRGGAPASATLTMNCPAPDAGWRINLSSSNTAVVTVPDSVVIPEGESSYTFQDVVLTVPVTTRTFVDITAKHRRGEITKQLEVLPGGEGLNLAMREQPIEVTQAVQCLDDGICADNALPLVKGKSTVVRVYPEVEGVTFDVPNVRGTLASRPCGASQWTYHPPLWPGATLRPGMELTDQRESSDHDLSFLVDRTYSESGCLDFKAEINPNRTIVETNYDDNTAVLSDVQFHNTRALNVKFVRIDHKPNINEPAKKPTWDVLHHIIPYLEKVYPVNRVNSWKARREINVRWHTAFKDFCKPATWGWTLFKLANLQLFSGETDKHYYALLDERVPHGADCPGGQGIAGMAWMKPFQKVGAGHAGPHNGIDYDSAATTAAHEIGHNLGRKHAPCGNPDDVDPSWPSSTNPEAIIGVTGFDVERQRALARASYRDFMSYCGPEWVSWYTYDALFTEFKLGGSSQVTSAVPVSNGADGEIVDHLIAGGVIDEEGDVTLADFYRKGFPAGTYAEAGAGPYRLVLRDAEGSRLFTRHFDVRGTRGAFFEILPYHPETDQIDIGVEGFAGFVSLASRTVSAHVPTVNVTFPQGGESFSATEAFTVTWTAADADADGDELSYMVLFSRDGGANWEALDMELRETSYRLDATQLPGTEQALIRVIASDGVHTGQDDSAATFVIERKPPEVVILSPDDGTQVTPGTAVLLRGAATDAEDGPLPDAALTWTSDRDGDLGIGTEVVARLTPGFHLVTLAGQDSDGNVSTATIAVEVAVAETMQITDDQLNNHWGDRHTTTSDGNVLWADGENISFFDGTTIHVVQEFDPDDDSLDLVEAAVFGISTGPESGQVAGAWRRGTDYAWVWTNNGNPPVLVDASNPFDPDEPLNPEAMAVADGCVFLALQAFDPDTGTLPKHVFEVDAATGAATNLTGDDAVPGADRITTSNCQAAWVFDDDTGTPKLHFYDGAMVHEIDSADTSPGSLPHLHQGKLVYAKPVDGVSQVFLYDSTATNPEPVQLTDDASMGSYYPRTDGRRVAWLRGERDGFTILNPDIVLNGGISLTDETTRLADVGFAENPLQLQRGQLIWEDASGNLRYFDGNEIRTIPIAPATTVSDPWLADGFITWYGLSEDGETDTEIFLYTGTPPDDADQPRPPLLVQATAGDGQVTVAWDQVLGASSYNLYLAEEPGVTRENFASLQGGRKISEVASPFTVTGLVNNRHYFFVVTSVEEDAEGPESREASAIPLPAWVAVEDLAGISFSALSVDMAGGNAAPVYAAGNGAGPFADCLAEDKVGGCDIFKSTDGGETWSPITGLVERLDARALAVHGPNVYAATITSFAADDPEKILRSSDGGNSWEAVVEGEDLGKTQKALAIDPSDPNTIYAGSFELQDMDFGEDSMVIKSIDGGETWSHLAAFEEEIVADVIRVHPLSGEVFVGGSGWPLVKSADGGETWSDLDLPVGFVTALALHPDDPDTIYVGTRDDGVYRKGLYGKSIDGGQTWEQKNDGLPDLEFLSINALLMHPAQPDTIYAGTSAGFFMTQDGGESWTAHNRGLPDESARWINDLVFTPEQRLIAGANAGLFLLDLSVREEPCYDFVDPPGVGIEDVQYVAAHWRLQDGQPGWDPDVDVDGDGVITVLDIQKVAAHLGHTC